MLSPRWSPFCLLLVQCFNAIFAATDQSLDIDVASLGELFSRATKRKVRWVFDVVASTTGEVRFTNPDTGVVTIKTVMASHSALWVDGNENNGPKRMEIGNDNAGNDA